MEKIVKSKRTYIIYTKQEADDRGIEYKYWRDTKPGEFALSDDNYVLKLLSISSPFGKPPRRRYVFPFGPTIDSGKNMFFYEKKRTRVIRWMRDKKKMQHFIHLLLIGVPKKKAFLIAYGDRAVRLKSSTVNIELGKLLNWEEFRIMFNKETLLKLEEIGVTMEDALKLLKKSVDLAKEENNISKILLVTDKLIDVLGLNKGAALPALTREEMEQLGNVLGQAPQLTSADDTDEVQSIIDELE